MTNRSLRVDPIALLIVLFAGCIFLCFLVFFSHCSFILPTGRTWRPFCTTFITSTKLLGGEAQERPRTRPLATISERTEYLTSDEFEERISDNDLLSMAEEETDLYSCQPLAQAFVSIASSLYAQESFDHPPVAPETTDRITLGAYYDQLQWWQRKVSDRKNHDTFLTTVITAYLNLRAHFPRYALLEEPRPSESNLTTQLVIENRGGGDSRNSSRCFPSPNSRNESCSST